MSDRRAVSAGHLGASSVAAANEAWRVAVGGNRVENMTVDQIAHAFHAGQLNVRTPLWPPGSTGWQALGNFAQFQNPASTFVGNAGYGANYGDGGYGAGLSQFEEADDDPTRMWTGGADDLPGVEAMQQAAMQQRPMARTGTRQVSRAAPSQGMASHAMAAPPPPPPPVSGRPVPSQPAAMPSTRSLPPAPTLASRSPALVPAPVYRQSRGNGLLLVAGLVGLVGLGSAVLAARGNWGSRSEEPANVEVAAGDTPSSEARSGAAPAAATGAQESAKAEASKAEGAKAEGGGAQLAKYDDTRATSTALAGGSAKAASETEASSAKSEALTDEPKEARKGESKREKADDDAVSTAKAERAAKAARRREERLAKKVSARSTAKRATLAALPRSKPEAETPPRAEKAEKPEKVEKAEKAEKPETTEAQQPPANAAVNEAAAAALANSANLASSCRPRGGPAGPGKARVIYSNDGEVQSVEILTAKFRDTLTGSCVRMVFRRAKIPPFKGEPPTFIKSFTIPEE